MSWIQTYTGKKFDPMNPTFDSINITDIAHALSMTCRFGGHCNRFYSVAEHCIHITERLIKEYPDRYVAHFYAILHDASEAYIGDMPKPIKAVMPEFRNIEERIQEVVIDKYFDWNKPNWDDIELVEQMDVSILHHEARDMMYDTDWVQSLPGSDGWVALGYLDPDVVFFKFLGLFEEVSGRFYYQNSLIK